MTTYYLDSSAWIRHYLLEAGTAFVTGLFENGEELACSTLSIVEVNATLARRRKSGSLSTDASAIFLKTLRHRQDYVLVGSDAELNAAAQRLGLRVVDPVEKT